MELKPLELSDLSPTLGLIESKMEPGVWHVMREKPAILAVQDHGLDNICAMMDDADLQFDQFKAVVDFYASILYAPGEVNGNPRFPYIT